VRILRSALNSGVHLGSVLLVYESNSDELGDDKEGWVVMFDNSVVHGSKDQSIKVDTFCLSDDVRSRILARSHGKEEGSDYHVGYHGRGSVEERRVLGGLEQLAEQSRSDSFLSIGWRIYAFECFEEGFDRRVQVLACLEVNGAWLESVPKRRSQTACGSADSVCDQWLRMSSFQLA
jgi:hypothetical protein